MFEYMEMSEDSAKEISKYYRKASMYINGQLDQIFNCYMSKFSLNEAEARQLLNMLNDETSIDELIMKLKSNLTTEERKELLAMLEAPAYRSRLNRLQNLQKEIDAMMREIYKQEKEISTNNYINVAKESYYKTMFDIQQRTGYGFSFSSINSDDFNRLINSKWSGANFSERIWSNTNELAKTLKEELIISLITGRKELDVAKIIENQFNVGNYHARRIVRTESCFIAGEMQAKAYKESGIEKYRFVATLDLKTSKICRELEGKVFELSKREVGKNYQPMHPHCRSTTISIIDDRVLSNMERIARDPETGKTYKVPANMTYKEWHEKYVESNPRAMNAEKAYHRRHGDMKQYNRYIDVLGEENMPKTFAEFQDMKYNDSERWELLKDYKKSRSNNMISAFTPFEQYVEYKNRIQNEIVGITTKDGITIKSQSKHFIERVFGTNDDPKTHKPRDGVTLEEIEDTLKNGRSRKRNDSWQYIKDFCSVSINQRTGNLIQVNRIEKGR